MGGSSFLDTERFVVRRNYVLSLLAVISVVVANPLGLHAFSTEAASFPAVDYPSRGQVALTFDDGPFARTTGQILDILHLYDVGATFFVVGYMANRSSFSRAVLKRAHDAGHSIQNHSWNHPHLASLKPDSIRRELARTSNLIERITGVAPTLFRPPYGSTSPRVRRVAESEGLRQMMWGASPRSMNATADQMVATVLGQARRYKASGKGLVILMHDGSGNRAGTVAALPRIIRGLKRAGWEFVVVR